MAQTTITTANSSWTGTSSADKVLINLANNVRVNTGAGNDSIYSYASRATIDAGAGNDTIKLYSAAGSSVNTGAGNDSIYSYASRATIDAGAGNDTIKLYSAAGSSVNAGAGNDKISLQGGGAYVLTVKGGTGNDTIYSSGNKTLHQYANGDGNDVILNWSANDTISITGGSYTRSTVGNDVVLKIGNYSVTIKNAKGKTINVKGTLGGGKNISSSKNGTLLTGTGYNDNVKNTGSNVRISVGAGNDSVYSTKLASIDAGAGNDTVNNTANYSTVKGGAGNDSIYSKANGAILYGDAGKDTIKVSGQSNYIMGGADNDFISVSGNGNYIQGDDGNDTINVASSATAVTILGGKGNDLIKSNNGIGRTFLFAAGDGNDTIENYNGGNISITGGSYTTSLSGSNVILKVGNDSLTIKDGKDKAVTVNGKTVTVSANVGVTINNTLSNKTLNGTAYADSITNSGAYVKISGGGGNDTIWSTNGSVSNVTIDGGAGNDRLELWGMKSSLNGGEGNDTIFTHAKNVTINSGAGNDYVENWDDNVGRSDDGDGKAKIFTGTGNDTVKNFGFGATINTGTGDDTILIMAHNRDGKIYTASRNIIQYAKGDGNDVVYNLGATDSISITGSTYTRSTVDNDVVLGVGTGSITVKDAKNKTVNVIGSLEGGNVGATINNTLSNRTLTGTNYADSITNSGRYVTINALDGNDFIYSNNGSYWGAYVTINAGDGNDTITGRFGDSSISGGAGADLVSMTGDVDRATINAGTGNDSIYSDNGDGRNVIQYAAGDGNDVLCNIGSADTISITGGTYTRSTVGNDVVLTVGNGSITVKDGKNKSFTIIGTESVAPNPTVPSGNVVKGTSGNDYISNSIAGAVVYAYGGNDTVYNYEHNDVTVYGGAGADSIKIQYSDNVAVSGGADNDKITVYSGNNASVAGDAGNDTLQVSGTGATISGGDGADSIKNNGNNALIYGGNGADVINNDGANSTLYGDAGNDYIYSYSSQSSVYGGSDNDYIYVYSNTNGFVDGGADNDTIKASYGNNISIKGGAGNDSINLYSCSCVIAYNSGDGYDTVVGFDGNDTLKVYGSYTRSTVGNDVVVNVSGGSITLKDAKNKTVNISNIYSAADLFDSDNFLTDDAQLSSVLNVEAANGLLDEAASFQNVTQLVKQSTLLTFGKK